MSTKAFIGIEQNGKIRGVHVANDGYVKYTGRKLFKYYTDSDKINTLIDGGMIWGIGNEVGYEKVVLEADHQSFGQGLVTRYMFRDMGLRDEAEIREYDFSFDDKKRKREITMDWENVYIWRNGKWHYWRNNRVRHLEKDVIKERLKYYKNS